MTRHRRGDRAEDAETRVAGVGDSAVREKTGRSWAQWLAALDRAGARDFTHKEIVAWLAKRPGVTPWWQQMIAVGYEQERGKRAKHEKPGGFEIGVSRTVAVPVETLFDAWTGAAARRPWIGGGRMRITTSTRAKSIRARWGDGATRLDVHFTVKGPQKSAVQVQHGKLPDAREAERMKTWWRERLDALKLRLEGGA